MNKMYCSIWNVVMNMWMVVVEMVKFCLKGLLCIV